MAPFVCTPCMTTTSSSDFNPSLQLHPCHYFARHSLCLAGRLAGPALLAVYITTAFVSPKSSTSCDGACPLSQAWCPRHLYHPCESPKSTFSCDGACPLSQAWCRRHQYHGESPQSTSSCDGACPMSQAWCPRHLYDRDDSEITSLDPLLWLLFWPAVDDCDCIF